MEKVLVSWSSGKDSALALHAILSGATVGHACSVTSVYDVVALLTAVVQPADRIGMHGVRRALLERQAAAIGIPLEIVPLLLDAEPGSYEASLRAVLAGYRQRGVTAVVGGDIYLESLRQERETKLVQAGMRAIFPLWGRDTGDLLRDLVRQGFKAVLTSVDTAVLDKSFLGRVIDAQFLAQLPASADACGENGEYHSFVFDGPIFARPVAFDIGEVTSVDGRYFNCDLIPA